MKKAEHLCTQCVKGGMCKPVHPGAQVPQCTSFRIRPDYTPTAGTDPHLAAQAADAVRLTKTVDALTQENERMAAAMQLFCDRVDAGEVRSRKTYAQFKEILAARSERLANDAR